ncbi:ABR189Wp [Eremothecium gossypii ATCC 10895]|uniref:Autophagy-related protein 21 n=1 Tax=Eremothecium gossypii (strain ATCC 10895 / CBS 109.51 / FGSC 9923 / NRRL Y-1056) TaxID=284811 RepID=ATG21_EREGS|nr:ABR189Wp [Eremothecium gossypii ATCC 10895]Q75D34.2 RecName: Full=Autophagy-related protein 21 [Eremothecium gossypii ATCC 10895]AAS50961.2 ABR189Wp [Eremothecium gossypii ATCC 10895]
MKVLRFNQDASCFSAVSRPHSMTIYNCDPFGKCFELENSVVTSESCDTECLTKAQGDQCSNFVTEMLFATSLIAVVNRDQGLQKARKLRIVNTKRKTTICELTFPHEVVDIVMNRKRMCVLLSSDQIFIYDISCMKLLQTISVLEDKLKMAVSDQGHVSTSVVGRQLQGETSMVRIALCSDDKSILCYTAYCRTNKNSYILNDLVVYDALNMTPLNYLNTVHKGNVACLCISNDGKMVATASDKGTIVRIFSTGDENTLQSGNTLLHEFRRGTRPCSIYEMKIDPTRRYLACVGHTDTIHIFDLERQGQQNKSLSDSQSTALLREGKLSKESTLQFASFLSKKVISKIPNQNMERHFAHIKVDDSVRHCLGFPDEFSDRVYVASNNGEFQVWNIPQSGGECILVKKSKF